MFLFNAVMHEDKLKIGMGTKVDCKSYLPGYFSMRDLNEDSSNNWPQFYGDKKTLGNGQYYHTSLPRTVTNAYPGGDKDALKETMLEHEAIFKHQVFELHRLYTRQRGMMDEINRKELHKHQIPVETSSSSSPFVSQIPSEDAWKWYKPNFPSVSSGSAWPSVSGTEITSSPLSCTKGNIALAGRIPSQNGSNSKDFEIVEFRPSKVRKKLFDLQLPADEYIDTEEGEQSPHNNTRHDISRNRLSIIHKISSESSVRSNFGSIAKIDCDGDASRLGSCSRNSVVLADLNEPILVEEAILPTSVDFMGRAACHAEIKDMDLTAQPKSQFSLPGLPKGSSQNSRYASDNGTSSNLHVENRRIGREWSSYIHKAGHSKSYLNSFPQGLQPDMPLMSSQPMHATLNRVHQPSGILPSDYSMRDLWGERTVHGLELAERSRDLSSSNHLEPVVVSHIPNPYPLVHTSNLDNGWSHSISTWGTPNSSLTHKLTSSQTHPPLDALGTLTRSSQASAQSHEIFSEKRRLNSSSGSNPSYGSGLPNCNGFYHGCSSGSRDIPTRFSLAGFDSLNWNKDDKVASERSINYGARSYLKGSNVVDMKPAKDLNLNADLSKYSSGDETRKSEGKLEVLPWLKAKTANKNEGTSTRRDSNSSELSFVQADSHGLSGRSEIVKGPNQLLPQKVTLPTCNHEVGAMRNEVGDCRVNGKILGFPIFNNSCTPKNESSSAASTSASLRCPPQHEEVKNGGKHRLIDINLACDPESGVQIAAEVLVVEKGRDKKVANFRTLIDLNSCASEDEFTLAPSFTSSSSVNVKIAVEINLEVPAVPETEEEILAVEDPKQNEMLWKSPQHEVEQPHDEAVKIAAGAIVAISSSRFERETPLADSLLWFVEIIYSYVDDFHSKFATETRGENGGDRELSSSDEIDEFEAMTLNLTEIKEEEYMPKPLVPETWKGEEEGSILSPNRPRRGQARRGRQRRDFQRDILPGLASLSRHEVTEDLQIFGGLMRATGHPWQSGLTRRKNGGAARGRRRSFVDPAPAPAPAVTEVTVCTPLMQQLSSFEVGLVDRSLTGWGKTPRRPRRQRCLAANPPPSIALA